MREISSRDHKDLEAWVFCDLDTWLITMVEYIYIYSKSPKDRVGLEPFRMAMKMANING